MTATLKAPMPYFGGKSQIASLVWERFGVADNLVEPFFGSGAITLAAPWPADRTETVNDVDALLCNFWRALQHDPEQTAYYADHPVNETDLHARHKWLVRRKPEVQALLDSDPDAHDPKAAGWWVWGISCWIGSGWCAQTGAEPDEAPHLGDAGQGIHRKRLHLLSRKGVHSAGAGAMNPQLSQQLPELGSDRGGHRDLSRKMPELGSDRGVHRDLSRKMPHVGAGWRGTEQGKGVHRTSLQGGGLYAYFEALAARLRRVRVCCGDWQRVLGPSVTFRHGLTAVFLDPPYDQDSRANVYAYEHRIFEDVRAWAVENGGNPLLRIAICGYDFEMPDGWASVRWKAAGGYGSQGNGRGRENAAREVVWFSPACLDPAEIARDALTRPISVRAADWSGTMFEGEL